MDETDGRDVLRAFYNHPYTRQVAASASARHGVLCRVTDNPIDGVVVVTDDGGADSPVVVELDEGEKTLLLIAVGKAFAKLVRL